MLYPWLAYDDVRALLGVTEDEWPDAAIGANVFLEAAQREVVARDPDAASRDTGAARFSRDTATTYLTAARMAPTLQRVTRERFGDVQQEYQAYDLDRWVAELRAQAGAAIAAMTATDLTITALRPAVFTTAPGGRGAW